MRDYDVLYPRWFGATGLGTCPAWRGRYSRPSDVSTGSERDQLPSPRTFGLSPTDRRGKSAGRSGDPSPEGGAAARPIGRTAATNGIRNGTTQPALYTPTLTAKPPRNPPSAAP